MAAALTATATVVLTSAAQDRLTKAATTSARMADTGDTPAESAIFGRTFLPQLPPNILQQVGVFF